MHEREIFIAMDMVIKKNVVLLVNIILMACYTNMLAAYGQSQQNHAEIDQQAFKTRFSKSFGAKAIVTIGEVIQDKQNIILTNVNISGDVLTPDTKFKKITFQNVIARPHGGYEIYKIRG